MKCFFLESRSSDQIEQVDMKPKLNPNRDTQTSELLGQLYQGLFYKYHFLFLCEQNRIYPKMFCCMNNVEMDKLQRKIILNQTFFQFCSPPLKFARNFHIPRNRMNRLLQNPSIIAYVKQQVFFQCNYRIIHLQKFIRIHIELVIKMDRYSTKNFLAQRICFLFNSKVP